MSEMKPRPRVSVLFPVYNAARFLDDALRSILGQRFNDFEVILVEDGSTDSTPQILREYSYDRRIRIIRNDGNRGLIESLNTAIEHARGEYCARMDADDISIPSRLEKQFVFMQNHNEVVAVGTGIHIIDEAGEIGYRRLFPTKDWNIRWCLCFYLPLCHPSVMMKTRALIEAGGYDKTYLHAEDYDLFVRLKDAGRLANIPEALHLVRKYPRTAPAEARPEYYGNAARISHRAMCEYLGNDGVDLNMILLIRGLRTGWDDKSAEQICELMENLVTTFADRLLLSRDIRGKLNKDAAMRLVSILATTRGWSWRDAARILYVAFAMDPLMGLSVLKKSLDSIKSFRTRQIK